MFLVSVYEAREDKAFKEPVLAEPDEPPPAPVMLAEPAYAEYPEPGQPGRTGGLVSDWLFVRAGARAGCR